MECVAIVFHGKIMRSHGAFASFRDRNENYNFQKLARNFTQSINTHLNTMFWTKEK